MNKISFAIWKIGLLFLCLTSCSKESADTNTGTGSFRLSLTADCRVISGKESSAPGKDETTEVDVNRFAVAITKYDETLYSWDSYRDMQEAGEPELRPSTYTLKAWQGNVNEEGFDHPCFAGSSELTIRKGETTPVAVTCYLANAKLRIAYTEIFKKYFEAYSAEVETSQANVVTYVQDEDRFAYFTPGRLTVKTKVRKAGQSQEAVYKVKEIDAKARHEYTLTLDVDAGSATMTVSFSDETANPDEEREFDVSDEAMNAPLPYFKATGFTDGALLQMQEGNLGKEISVYLNAMAGIASCKLTTTSAYLLNKGWPAEVELTAPGEQNGKLKEFELETRGLTGNTGQMAWVNFTKLLGRLPARAGETHRFVLTATDRYGKTEETPLQLMVSFTEGGQLVITPLGTTPFLSQTCKVKLTFQSDQPDYQGNPAVVKFFLGNDPEAVMTCKELLPGEDRQSFTATLSSPAGLKFMEPFTVSGEYFGKQSAGTPAKVGQGILIMNEGEVWATKTYLHLFNAEASEIRLQYQEGQAWKDFAEVLPAGEYVPGKGRMIEAKGLKSDRQYRIRAVSRLEEEQVSNECEIHTEASTQIPNSGFEDWYEEVLYSQHILWAKNSIYGFYFWKQGTGEGERWWDTTNPITTPDPGSSSVWDYRSAPGVVPTARKEETASFHLNKHGGQPLTTEGHTGNAIEIATVGWGDGDTWISSSSQPSFRTAGQVYLGKHGSPAQYGKGFTSRPLSVKFWYKYYSYNNEETTPYVELFDEHNERIGFGKLKISGKVKGAESTFTQGEIKIEYSYPDRKAHRLSLVFPSTDSESPATRAVGGSANAFSGYLDSRHIGSILTIDDIELIY